MNDPSFAQKHSLPLQKVHKFSNGPRTHGPVVRSYQSTKRHDASLYQVAIKLESHLKKPVEHSVLIRGLIQLVARDEALQQKLMELIEHENVYRGKVQKQF